MFKNAIFLFLCLAILPCYSQSKTLKVVGSEFPKILQKCEGGKVCGVAVDILKEMETKLDVHFDIEILPWARALDMIKRK